MCVNADISGVAKGGGLSLGTYPPPKVASSQGNAGHNTLWESKNTNLISNDFFESDT